MSVVSNFFYALAFIFIIFMCFFCFRRKKKNQGVIFTTVQAVPVTNQTIAVAPGTAYIATQSRYPTQHPPIVATAYPVAQGAPMQMPQPYHGVAPPPMQMPQPYVQGMPPGQFACPPPYDQVVKDPYQQQSPYNPHYTGH